MNTFLSQKFQHTNQPLFVHLLPSQLLPRRSHWFAVGPFSTASVCNSDKISLPNWAPSLYNSARSVTSFVRFNSKWLFWLVPKSKASSGNKEEKGRFAITEILKKKIFSLKDLQNRTLQALKVIPELFWAPATSLEGQFARLTEL